MTKQYEIITTAAANKRTINQDYLVTKDQFLCKADFNGSYFRNLTVAEAKRYNINNNTILSYITSSTQIFLQGVVKQAAMTLVLQQVTMLDYSTDTNMCLFLWDNRFYIVYCKFICFKSPKEISALYFEVRNLAIVFDGISILRRHKTKYDVIIL